MHLRQPGFTYIACGSFTKIKDRIKKITETVDSRYKTCFQHDSLNRITAANKVLRDKAFNIDKNSNCDGYQHGLSSMVDSFLDKNFWWSN